MGSNKGKDLTTLEPLAPLKSLKYLNVRKNKLKSLQGIQGLKNLRQLNVASNLLKDWDIVNELENLEEVVSYGNNFSPGSVPLNISKIARPMLDWRSVCEFAQQEAFRRGLVTQEQFDVYTMANFIPQFEIALDTESKLIGWGACKTLFETIR